MKRLLSFVMAIIFAMQLSAQQDSVAIGSGTPTSQIGPVPGYYGNHRSVQLYTSSELNMPMGGVIEALSFELGTVSGTESNRQVRIYMKEVGDLNFAKPKLELPKERMQEIANIIASKI